MTSQPWFSSSYGMEDSSEGVLPASVEDVSVALLRRVNEVLLRDAQFKAELLDDAVACLHEAGAHEAADRIERLASPF